jgi:hypothetical protein
MMKDYIATFGLGSILGKNFVRVPAESAHEARRTMFAIYGNLWAFLYEDEDAAGVNPFKLTEVPLGTPNAKKP